PFFDPADGSTDPGSQLFLGPLWMELHEPVQHRAIRHPTYLHLTHSFQEKLFLSEVYPRSELYCLLAGLRVAETIRVMTIETLTRFPYPELTLNNSEHVPSVK